VLQGCGKLQAAISYFLATRSSQMNVEAATDVNPNYELNPFSIISIQVRVRDLWVGVLWACVLIFVWLRANICVGEWSRGCGKLRGSTSCEVWFSTSSQPDKNPYMCTVDAC